MSVGERRRAELFDALKATIGTEAAVTLFEVLPPSGEAPATARQVSTLEQRMDDRFVAFEQRMDDRFVAFEQRMLDRFAAQDQRMAQLERSISDRFAVQDQRIEDRFALQDQRIDLLREELLAAFRGELVAAVSGQTRHLIVAMATALFGVGGLAVTFAQLL